jgi:HEAT repeat protein
MSATPAASAPPSGMRFGMRDLLFVILLVAVGLAWWRDHRQQASRQDLYQRQLADLLENKRVNVSATEAVLSRYESALKQYQTELDDYRFHRLAWTSSSYHPSQTPPPTPEEFVAAVADGNMQTFQQFLQPFAMSPRAQEAVDGLIPLLTHFSPIVRTQAAQALGRIRGFPDKVVPALIPLLDDSHRAVGSAAVFALGNIGSRHEGALAALRNKMNDDGSDLAVQAAVALDQIDSTEDIGPRLIELLKSPRESVRITALGHLPDHVDAEEIERVLAEHYPSEASEFVKRAMARALNRVQADSPQRAFQIPPRSAP